MKFSQSAFFCSFSFWFVVTFTVQRNSCRLKLTFVHPLTTIPFLSKFLYFRDVCCCSCTNNVKYNRVPTTFYYYTPAATLFHRRSLNRDSSKKINLVSFTQNLSINNNRCFMCWISNYLFRMSWECFGFVTVYTYATLRILLSTNLLS